ncbi:TPA: hypothetical protein ACH3X3_013488 [Trebouxia sp. C0006]
MSTQQQRREANKAGRFYNVKSGVNNFFTDEVLLQQIQQAVQLVIPLLVEGNLLANLHVLRCIEAEEAIPNWTRLSSTDAFMLSHLALVIRHSSSTRHLLQVWQPITIPCTVRTCQQITRDQRGPPF